MNAGEKSDGGVTKRGRGRPPVNGVGAMSPAVRKREERSRLMQAVAEVDDSQWTDAVCLWVLTSGKVPVGSPLDKAAWRQLGKLRGYL